VYASQVGEQQLTFFVSGKLWGQSLVMQDQETGSQWSHILGRAMEGRLQGTALDVIPSVITTWQDWLDTHPETTVAMLPRTAVRFTAESIRRPARFGLGLVHAGQARFWRFDRLEKLPIVNDQMAEMHLVVFFDEKSRSAYAWHRKLEGHVLDFRWRDGRVEDGSGSLWDLRGGRAESGPLSGKQLSAAPAILSYSDAWRRFHPDSSEWKP
jgi:hypothetical protein